MTRAEYAADVWARFAQAEPISLLDVMIAGEPPKQSECHRNVDRWIVEHPGFKAVRGWATYIPGSQLAAHSLVEDHQGRLFDITPLSDEKIRGGQRFVRHCGDDESFFREERRGRILFRNHLRA